jgi:hypothetical protein
MHFLLAALLAGVTQSQDACGLVTQAEADALMGTASRAPRVGAFAPNTCTIQSESDAGRIYINTGFETDAILQTRGMDGARQAFEGIKCSVDDEEAVPGAGDEAFYSKKINGLYILTGGAMVYILLSPDLAKSPAHVAALKKLAPTIASRIR